MLAFLPSSNVLRAESPQAGRAERLAGQVLASSMVLKPAAGASDLTLEFCPKNIGLP